MANSHAIRLIITTAFVSFLSIVCFCLGYLFNVWWIIETSLGKQTVGLWKTCTFYYTNATDVCVEREFIFDKKGLDPIITFLIISTGFTVFILFSSLLIISGCIKKPSIWNKTINRMTYFVLISFVAAADAMLYTELEFKDTLAKATRGWAYMISWVGAGLQFILFVLIIVQLYVKPPLIVDMTPW